MRYLSDRTRKLALYSMLVSLSLSIWVFEEFIPRPAPWLKPGFSYIPVIIGMELMGTVLGGSIALLRSFLGALIFGRLFSASFILSISGASAAVIIMSLLFPLRGKMLTYIGISVAGAFTNILAQLIIAGKLFYDMKAMLILLPPSTLWTVFAGAVVGILANAIIKSRVPVPLKERKN